MVETEVNNPQNRCHGRFTVESKGPCAGPSESAMLAALGHDGMIVCVTEDEMRDAIEEENRLYEQRIAARG